MCRSECKISMILPKRSASIAENPDQPIKSSSAPSSKARMGRETSATCAYETNTAATAGAISPARALPTRSPTSGCSRRPPLRQHDPRHRAPTHARRAAERERALCWDEKAHALLQLQRRAARRTPPRRCPVLRSMSTKPQKGICTMTDYQTLLAQEATFDARIALLRPKPSRKPSPASAR